MAGVLRSLIFDCTEQGHSVKFFRTISDLYPLEITHSFGTSFALFYFNREGVEKLVCALQRQILDQFTVANQPQRATKPVEEPKPSPLPAPEVAEPKKAENEKAIWEYTTVSCPMCNPQRMNDYLNLYGLDGWEAVSISNHSLYEADRCIVFKRRR